MKWRSLINMRLSLLSVFLFSLFFSFIISSESYATNVTCTGSLSSATGQDLFTNCDTSSLDQSSHWYYRFKITNTPNFSVYNNDSKICFAYLSNMSCSSSESVQDSNYVISVANYRFANFTYYFRDNDNSKRFRYMSSYKVSNTFTGTLNFEYFVSDESPFSVPDCPEPPSGSLDITSNGTYDVTDYASAVVNVPESSGGDGGSTDVSGIVNALYVIAAVPLVIYFFYCIYRMIIKTTGAF